MSKKLRSLFILLAGVGLAYWFVSRLEWSVVKVHLQQVRIWPLVAAMILITLTMVARALRWQTLLAPITKVTFHHTFVATAVGFGSIFIFGRAGEVVRPVVLSLREKVPPSATIASIMIERLFDTMTVVALFACNLLIFALPAGQAEAPKTMRSIHLLGLLMFIGMIVGIAVLVLIRLNAPVLIGWLKKRTQGWPERVSRPLLNLIRHLAEGLSVLVNFRELLGVAFYSAAVWGLVAGATWLVARAFNVDFSFSHAIFVMGFGLVGSVVPTPGGSAGAFHKAAQVGLMFLGIEQNLAAAIAIVYHLIAFGTPFVIGLFYLVRDGLSLTRLRELIAQEHAA